MTTTIHQFADWHFGGAPPNGVQITLSLSGSAAAGDWIGFTTSGRGGDGDQPVVASDNISGTTGWVKLADFTDAGGGPWRTQTWAKKCVGGETEMVATWPGSSNKSATGFWVETPTQPSLYVITQGQGVYDAGLDRMVLASSPGDILTDAESYIASAAGGSAGLSDAQFTVPPSPPTEGGASGVASGEVWTVAHYNDDEGSNNTGQTLQYQIGPSQTCYMVWLGFSEGVVELAGDAGVIDATGELEATGGIVDLAGAASPVTATGDLETEGGGVQLAGVAGLVTARGRLVSPPPHPVPGPPDLTDLLDCGVYDAMVFTRGLGEIVGRLPFGQVDWGRVLDGVSTGSLTVDGVANRSQLQKCCRLLGEVEPFEHELAIYRNGYRVWSGPITAMTFPPNEIQISAFDLSGWLQVRTLHEDYNAVQVDLINIWIRYVQDAMAVDNSPGLHPTALALSGILADRLTQITEHNVSLDAIGELERTGIDWTTIDRVMQAGPVLTQPPSIANAGEFPLLIDSSFRVPPTILLDGLQGANCWYVQGGAAGSAGAVIFGEYGPEFPATPDHVAQPAAPDYAAIESQYGRIEKIVSESRVLDQPSIDDNAKSRYALTKRPVAVISEGLLLPSAPIAMRKLVPGSLVQVHLANACKPVGDFYRIKSVKVTAHGDGSEDVNVEFQPIGTGTVLED